MTSKARGQSRDRILHLLKTRGPQTAAELARRLEITAMAARQHLQGLTDDGLVEYCEQRGEVGRPKRIWELTEAAAAQFPAGYADLTVDLLQSLRRTFGDDGVERLVADRTRQQIERYRQRLPSTGEPLKKRVAALARARTDEGYMAEWRARADGSFVLVENHCPICAAVDICQGLCSAELQLFRTVLGDGVTVERTEHMVDGARRCCYAITPA